MNAHALKRRHLPLVFLVLAGIGIGATLLSLDSSTSSTPKDTEADPARTAPTEEREPPINEVEAGQREAFALLRGPSEEAPGSVKLMLSSEGHGLNFSLAQLAKPNGSPYPVWVIPGNDWLCVFIEEDGGGAASCDTTEGAASDGIDLALADDAGDGQPATVTSTYGIVPDDVEAIRFKGNQRGPETVEPEENAFYVDGGSSHPEFETASK